MKAKIRKSIKAGTILAADGHLDSFEPDMKVDGYVEFKPYSGRGVKNWYVSCVLNSFNYHISWLKNIKNE